jgi:hypothetical protein
VSELIYDFHRGSPSVAITGIEWWDFALIALPELITLVLCILRSRPMVFVGIVGVHFEESRYHVVGMSIWWWQIEQ